MWTRTRWQRAASCQPFRDSRSYGVAVYLRALLNELGWPEEEPTWLLCDNESAVKVTVNPHCFTKKIRHIRARLTWLKEQLADETIRITHIPTKLNLADLQTKPLGRVQFEELVPQCMGLEQPKFFQDDDFKEKNESWSRKKKQPG